MSQHTKEALALHKAMVDLGAESKSADVIVALALTIAYGIKYHSINADPLASLRLIDRLVLLEVIDPNSEMARPS